MIALVGSPALALEAAQTVGLTIDLAVAPTVANDTMVINIAVPPAVIRVVPLVIGPAVVPGVANVRRDLLGIGLGVGIELTPTDVILIGTLVTMALHVSRLSLLFLPHLLYVHLLLSLCPLMIDFLNFCLAL